MNTDQTLPTINSPYLEDFLVRLLNTPSPPGFASAAVDLVAAELAGFDNVSLQRTKKGALLINLAGAASSGVKRALTAHVDTLGAMVKSIKPSGRLALTSVGGFAWGSVEGEGCSVHTRRNGALRGSLLPNQASVHVYSGVRDEKRSAETMEVRLDARVQSAEDTHNLGIEVGDFVLVPAGGDNHIATVEVVNIEYFSEENVPLPVDKTKRIIRKCTEEDFNL